MRPLTLCLITILTVFVGASTTNSHDPSFSTIYQFPDASAWVENIAVRPNGKLLVTRVDVPELWSVDPIKDTVSFVHTFTNATTVDGITEIGDDEYALVSLASGDSSPVPNSTIVWKVSMGSKNPAVSIIKAIPEMVLPNGMTTFNRNAGLILISDSIGGAIYRLDVRTGVYSITLKDPATMDLVGRPPGINGVRIHGDYVYYTNTIKALFARVRVNARAEPVGPYEIITTGLYGDDFAIDESGTAYVCNNPVNEIVRVTPDGNQTVLAGNVLSLDVAGPTSCQFANAGWKKERLLYCTTCGGQAYPINGTVTEPGKILAVKL